MVHFRVTEQEFDDICAACRLDGIQNVSEFARGTLVSVSRTRLDAVVNGGIQNQLDALGQKMSRVDTVLGELISALKPARKKRKSQRLQPLGAVPALPDGRQVDEH